MAALTLKGGNQRTFVNTVSFALSDVPLLSTVSLGDYLFPNLQTFSISNCPLCLRVSIGSASCDVAIVSAVLSNLENLQEITIGMSSFSNISSLTLTNVPKLKASGLKFSNTLLMKDKLNLYLDVTSDLAKELVSKNTTMNLPVRSVDQIINISSPIYVNSFEWREEYKDHFFNQVSWNCLLYLQSLVIHDNACATVTSFRLSELKCLKSIAIGKLTFAAKNGLEFHLSKLPSLKKVQIGCSSFTSFSSVVIKGRLLW